jgi:NAD(P)-dependent dehydrogenase (short-subunit alcohol dehydrogenase family)
MIQPKDERHHGLNSPSDPRQSEVLPGAPPGQDQQWPGSDRDLQPSADHGEETYQGGGKLTGKKALITGGDSGIGRAAAIALAREGADVAISYYNEHDDARETVAWVEKAGRQALALPGDLQDPAHCRSLVEQTAATFGGLNILINNAAFHLETGDFLQITPEQLERTFRTNLFSYFWMAQNAVPHLRAGDSILNVGSVVAFTGHPKLADYAATKAAIHNFTQSLARSLAERRIRVNCIAPGPVWTPLIPATRPQEKVEAFGADNLWGRPAQPAEIAPTFVFLASEDGRFYSGDVFSPTGRPTTSR